MAREIVRRFDCELKVFVDTAPVMEKSLAVQTQLGWQGKHTCMVSRAYGSWLFLGEIIPRWRLNRMKQKVIIAGRAAAV